MQENKFNPPGSQLRKLQLRQLEILKTVDRICKTNGIPYWLSSGTLLGAVRHKGFIPWDDDLDIEIFREDVSRFANALRAELPEKYVVQTHTSDPAYVAPYMKVREIDSKICEMNDIDANYRYRGIYIDVFILEHGFRWWGCLSDKLHARIYHMARCRHFDHSQTLRVATNWMYGLMTCVDGLMRRLAEIFSDRNKLHYVPGSMFGHNYTLRCDWFLPQTSIVFEEHLFPAPADSHAYLSAIYGDYMTPPPADEISNHTYHIEF